MIRAQHPAVRNFDRDAIHNVSPSPAREHVSWKPELLIHSVHRELGRVRELKRERPHKLPHDFALERRG